MLEIEFPSPGLNTGVTSDGILLCRQVYVIANAVVFGGLVRIKPFVPVTVIGTEAVAPAATEKVAVLFDTAMAKV